MQCFLLVFPSAEASVHVQNNHQSELILIIKYNGSAYAYSDTGLKD